MSDTVVLLVALTAVALAASAPQSVQAQASMPTLAGAPAYAPADPSMSGPYEAAPDAGHAKECYAKVKFGAQYGVAPPTGPQFTWRQEPGPPGSPGPIWCLAPTVSTPRQILISPERYGWIRVLCQSDATPARIVGVQRQLSAAGVYQGPVDGRYDLNTTAAVQRFQAQRHIEDRGYLSYATLSALTVYSQPPSSQSGYAQYGYDQAPYPYPQPGAWACCSRPLTTLDTGVITWPGKR